jgi:hypothetical protein
MNFEVLEYDFEVLESGFEAGHNGFKQVLRQGMAKPMTRVADEPPQIRLGWPAWPQIRIWGGPEAHPRPLSGWRHPRGLRRQSEAATLASDGGKWWFKCL